MSDNSFDLIQLEYKRILLDSRGKEIYVHTKSTVRIGVINNPSDPEIELLYKLGMPRDTDHVWHFINAGRIVSDQFRDKFKNIGYELFGVQGPKEQSEVLDSATVNDLWRVQTIKNEPEFGRAGAVLTIPLENKPRLHLHIWRQRLFVLGEQSPPILERLWDSRRRHWFTLIFNIDTSRSETVDKIKRLADAFPLLDFVVRSPRGGARNVKVANLDEAVRKALGIRYAELKQTLTSIKRDARTLASTTDDWRPLILKKYPVLNSHLDLLDSLDPYAEPIDADASGSDIAPWKIAIEIAARETISNYESISVTPDVLRRVAILPAQQDS